MGSDRNVLLVEDEALVAALAVDGLEELGYRTVEVSTSKAAMEAVSGNSVFVFAIIDVGLPDGRGDALALKMRELRADLPIIIATGYDGAHLDERVRNASRTAILSKPYDIGQLQQAIKSIS